MGLGRKFAAIIVLVGLIGGLALTANSAQAVGDPQTVPTRRPSATATTAGGSPTTAATSVTPTKSSSATPVQATRTTQATQATSTTGPSSTPQSGASATVTETPLSNPTGSATVAGEIEATEQVTPSETPTQPGAVSSTPLAFTPTPVNTIEGLAGADAASSQGIPPGWIVAGLLVLLLLGLFYVLPRRKNTPR